MKFSLEINCDNDAFAPDPGAEVARILRRAAKRIDECPEDERGLQDVNGNHVGQWRFTDDD